jgi:hypothetical protein
MAKGLILSLGPAMYFSLKIRQDLLFSCGIPRSSFPFPFSVLDVTNSSLFCTIQSHHCFGYINCESFTSAVGLNEARFLEGLVFLRALQERFLALSCLDIADGTQSISNEWH